MNEKIQFIFWCWRKLFEHLFCRNRIIGKFFAAFREMIRTEPGIVFLVWMLVTVIGAVIVLGISLLFDSTGGHNDIFIITEITISVILLLNAGIGALYDAFKDNQQNLIDRIKQ